MQTTLVNPKLTVIQPLGFINSTNALEFEKQLTTTLAKEECSILLVDLEQVESMDSAGVLALVSALKVAQRLGRRLSLCSVSPAIQIIFELTQLDRLFEMFESQSAFTDAYCLKV